MRLMPDSHVIVRIHMIFSTKGHRPIISKEMQPRFWAYLHCIAKNLGCNAPEIGGVADHVHLLIELSPRVAIAGLAQKLKANSSRWMHENGAKLFAWQAGYAAFGVSISNADAVREYIRNQTIHHAKRDHAAELDALFKKHGILVPSLRDSES